jgi:hypothetical protein
MAALASESLRGALIVGTSLLLAACGIATDDEVDSTGSAVVVPKDRRDRAARAASIWDEDEWSKLPEKDLWRGQSFEGAPTPGQEIVCKFKELESADDKPNGRSPKFLCGPCELTDAEVAAGKKPCTVKKQIKVKYSGKGRPVETTDPATVAGWAREDAKVNGEVFAEVLGTRLLWALGFYADGVYPVKVVCYGCPENPWQVYERFPRATRDERADRRWEYAAVEVKMPGTKIEDRPDSGFDWKADAATIVPRADPAADGAATKVEVDAWRLLAAFMTHADNKAENQRLFCAQGKMRDDGTCDEPRAMIQDIGLSFGVEGLFFGIAFEKATYDGWREWPLWKRPQDRERDEDGRLEAGQCQARLQPLAWSARQHTLRHPIISEQGRAFLSRLMDPAYLTDEMLTTIFRVSRVAERFETTGGRPVTVADWVRLFNQRRAEILRGCPEQHR